MGEIPANCLAEAAPFADFCNGYANDAVAQAKKNLEMKCGLEKDNPNRWALTRDDHFNWCMSWEGANSEPASEGSIRRWIEAVRQHSGGDEREGNPDPRA